MHNKLIYFIMIFVFLVLITGISAANPGISVAYIYSSDISSANSYKSLLDGNEMPTSLIYRDDAINSDFSKYNVIIIGSDITLTDSINDAALVSAIDNSGKSIVALGEGGYSIFGQFKLNTGSPYGWHGSTNSVYALDISNPIFNKPYTISIPGNNIIQLYTSTGHVGIYLPSIPSNVVPVGRESTDPNHYPLTLEDGKYLLWGFTGSPDTMTDDGKHLFVNVINYMAGLSEESAGRIGENETGKIYVYTSLSWNPDAAVPFENVAFKISGPDTYSGNGSFWTKPDALAGTYTINYEPVNGYKTPASETKTLIAGDSITFSAGYNYTLKKKAGESLDGIEGR